MLTLMARTCNFLVTPYDHEPPRYLLLQGISAVRDYEVSGPTRT